MIGNDRSTILTHITILPMGVLLGAEGEGVDQMEEEVEVVVGKMEVVEVS